MTTFHDHHKRLSQSGGRVPFAGSCEATPVGHIVEFAECLSKAPGNCVFRVAFGSAYFCWHPQHQEIISRTKPSNQPRA